MKLDKIETRIVDCLKADGAVWRSAHDRLSGAWMDWPDGARNPSGDKPRASKRALDRLVDVGVLVVDQKVNDNGDAGDIQWTLAPVGRLHAKDGG